MEPLYVSGVFTSLRKSTYITINKETIRSNIDKLRLHSMIIKTADSFYLIILSPFGTGRPIKLINKKDVIELNIRHIHFLSKDKGAQIRLSEYNRYGSVLSFEIKSNIKIKETNILTPFFSKESRLHIPRCYFPNSKILYFQWILQGFDPPKILIEISNKKDSIRINAMTITRNYFRSSSGFTKSDQMIYLKTGQILNSFKLEEVIVHDKYNLNFILTGASNER